MERSPSMAHEHFDIAKKQADLTAMMDRVLVNNRLGHAYIFEGMVGSGQEDMSQRPIWIASIQLTRDTLRDM